MELNAEQIKKALECCAKGCCGDCPCFPSTLGCCRKTMLDALALIKELSEENERLRGEKEAAVDDLERCMYYANPKRSNTCNFCTHDCEVSQDGTRCKGKDKWMYCSPVWRGVVKAKAEEG